MVDSGSKKGFPTKGMGHPPFRYQLVHMLGLAFVGSPVLHNGGSFTLATICLYQSLGVFELSFQLGAVSSLLLINPHSCPTVLRSLLKSMQVCAQGCFLLANLWFAGVATVSQGADKRNQVKLFNSHEKYAGTKMPYMMNQVCYLKSS
ncbi:hypothetical protein U1Q18_026580 [Sarracenia purpurea var. burkii]